VLSILVVLIVGFGRAVISAEKKGQWGIATTGQAFIVLVLLYLLANLIDDIRKGI
jgi:VIT1/CCC1 family predicted Fe2+/Mn2+ transporter